MLTINQQVEQLLKEPVVNKGPKLVIIDDNQEFLEELQEILSQSGYQVRALSDSQVAMALIYAEKPDLVLTDLKMSPNSGFQIAEQLRHTLQLQHIPIIAMTGFFTEKENILMMKLCGIKAFILKPFKPADLIYKIEFALGNRSEEYDNRPPAAQA